MKFIFTHFNERFVQPDRSVEREMPRFQRSALSAEVLCLENDSGSEPEAVHFEEHLSENESDFAVLQVEERLFIHPYFLLTMIVFNSDFRAKI